MVCFRQISIKRLLLDHNVFVAVDQYFRKPSIKFTWCVLCSSCTVLFSCPRIRKCFVDVVIITILKGPDNQQNKGILMLNRHISGGVLNMHKKALGTFFQGSVIISDLSFSTDRSDLLLLPSLLSSCSVDHSKSSSIWS